MPSTPLRIRARAWLQERLPLGAIDRLLAHKTVPLHAQAVWYYLGSVILLALLVLIGTGILLAVYYQPHVPADPHQPGAHESVRRIVQDLPHGWWIRSIHHWAGHLMIMALLVHLLSTLLLKAYRKPRELTWWTGLLLLGLTLAAGFTGYLLPWNSLSFAATRVGAGIAGATPLAGPLIHKLLLGGPDVTELTLTRFFALHVAVLPLLIVIVVGLHLLLVVYHGSSVPPSVQRRVDAGAAPPAVRFWPEFAYRDLRGWLLVFAALVIVAFFYPPPVGTRADPLAPTPEGTKPEWYFLALFKVLKLLPDHVVGLENLQIGVLGSGLVILALVALPVLDVPEDHHSATRHRRHWQRRLLLLAGFGLGWAATAVAARGLLVAYWPARSGPLGALAAPILCALLALAWLIPIALSERTADRRYHSPVTLFGVVLVSTLTGYTFWEAFGAAAALGGLAVLWIALLLIRAEHRREPSGPSRWARPLAALLLLGALFVTVPLGKAHAPNPPEVSPPPPAAAATGTVSPDRTRSAGQFAAVLVLTALLLVVAESQIRYHRKLRELGLFR